MSDPTPSEDGANKPQSQKPQSQKPQSQKPEPPKPEPPKPEPPKPEPIVPSEPIRPKEEPFKHSMKKRAKFHDYRRKGFYMLTIVVRDRSPLLGELVIDDKPHMRLTPLGKEIYFTEIAKINKVYPAVEVWRTCMMPDHIHFIIRVKEDLPEGKHLGIVVAGFKSGCNQAYWRINGEIGDGLFEEGYNDRLLFGGEHLKRWKKYLADNPRRLAVKRQCPDLFKVIRDYNLFGRNCQITGNHYLLQIPDKMAVIVHRTDSDDDFDRKFNAWMACGERGGVLVGASIAKREKLVMREAMNRGYNIILMRQNGFPAIYKPSGESFNACADGHLLQISPWDYHMTKDTITRPQCVYLNKLAEAIAAPPVPQPAKPAKAVTDGSPGDASPSTEKDSPDKNGTTPTEGPPPTEKP